MMQSSYRIIKNYYVSDEIEELPIIDTEPVYEREEDSVPEDLPEIEPSEEQTIEEISKEFLVELEHERLCIIEDANKEAEKIKHKAYQDGYEDGFKSGYEQAINEAKEEAIEIKNNAMNLIKQANDYISEYISENKEKIIRLAADMAETITHFSIDTSQENILALVEPILQQYRKHENIIITCHPDNSTFIKNKLDKLKNSYPEANFIILKDNSLEKNGCIIENENQIIDLQIKKQINSILEYINNLE